MTSREQEIQEAHARLDDIHAFLTAYKAGKVSSEAEWERKKAFIQLTDHILEGTRPKYFKDKTAHVMHQGNWPVDAEYAVVIITHDRDFRNLRDEELKFFSSEKALAHYLKTARGFYPGSCFACELVTYRWDLGPELMTREHLN